MFSLSKKPLLGFESWQTVQPTNVKVYVVTIWNDLLDYSKKNNWTLNIAYVDINTNVINTCFTEHSIIA